MEDIREKIKNLRSNYSVENQGGTDYCIAITTVNDEDQAMRLKNLALTKKLAACVNKIDGVSSFFKWKGDVEEEEEIILIFKTRKDLVEELKKEILIAHDYEIAEFIVLPISDISLHYADWLDQELKRKE